MKLKVLLVDDEPRSLKLIITIFEMEGYDVYKASHGREAMEMLALEKVDLIITDILMPYVDGYYLCYKIRNDERLKDIPIIIYSATYASVSEEDLALRMGANLFIRKPAHAMQLINAAKSLVGNTKSDSIKVTGSPGSFEVMHQYSSDLISKLEQRNVELEEIRQNLERKVKERTDELVTINEELTSTNDQLMERNEELTTLNEKLIRAAQIIQEQSEIIVRQKDEQLNRVLDSSNDVIWSFDLTGNGANYISRSAQAIYGATLDKLIQEKRLKSNTINKEDAIAREASWQQMEDKGTAESVYRVILPSGVRWMHERIKLIHNEKGESARIEGIATDITSIKEAEFKMEEYRRNLDLIFQNSSDFFILLNTKAEVILFNKKFENYVRDFARQTPKVGMNYFDAVSPNRREAARRIIDTVLLGERISTISETIWSGEIRYYNVNYAPVLTQGMVTHITVTSTDITEKKKQEDILKESRENLEIIFKNSSDYFQLMDASGKLVLFNQKYEDLVFEVSGKMPRVGMPYGMTLDAATLEIHKKIFERVHQGETIYRDVEVKTPSGEKYFEMRCSPVIAEGIVTHISVSSTDITERKKIEVRRKQVEEELKRNQFFLEKASESASIGYWTSELDFENGKLTWSKEVFNIFQLSEDDFDGRNKTFFDFIHPEDKDRVLESSRIAIEQDQFYNVDHRIVLKNGQVRWVNERGKLIRNESDGSVLMVGIVQDINDRKLIEQVLREYNDRHEIVSKATNDAIWEWDILNDKEIWNHGMETIFGYKAREIETSHAWWKEKIHRDDFERVDYEIQSAFSNLLANWTSEYRYLCSDGSYKNVLDRAYIIYHNNQPVRMIGAMQDVTEVVQYRENLENLVEERTNKLNTALLKEKELVDLKSKFISIASHEFRTPLTTIRLASGFIKRYKGKLEPDQLDEKIHTIEKEVHHMTSLVDDVLFVGKAEDGKVKVNLKEYSVDIIEKLALEAMKSGDENHFLDLTFDNRDTTFKSDEKLLRNIIFNLITNAVKFSPAAKRIVMRVQKNNNHLTISVRDEGIGIPQTELKNLFLSFSRATNASTIEGTGLGLLIIKKAVDLLNGSVDVWSELGKGTEFTVTLPTL